MVPQCPSFYEGASLGLLDALSEGMHSMAQPLTVLRATLEVASGNASCISHYQRAIDSSLVEVSRVVETMGFVQELVRIARDIKPPEPVSVGTVISQVVEDLRCVLDDAEVSLKLGVPPDTPAVLALPSGLRQCLFHLVQQAQSEADRGDVIDLYAHSDTHEMNIVICRKSRRLPTPEPRSRGACRFAPEARLMTLAEALAAAQNASLQWQAHPFVARLRLPVATSVPTKQENIAYQG